MVEHDHTYRFPDGSILAVVGQTHDGEWRCRVVSSPLQDYYAPVVTVTPSFFATAQDITQETAS